MNQRHQRLGRPALFDIMVMRDHLDRIAAQMPFFSQGASCLAVGEPHGGQLRLVQGHLVLAGVLERPGEFIRKRPDSSPTDRCHAAVRPCMPCPFRCCPASR